MKNKYRAALDSLEALLKKGPPTPNSHRGFIFEHKEMLLGLLDNGHKVIEIHAILKESGVHIKVPTLRAYLSEIKKQGSRN